MNKESRLKILVIGCGSAGERHTKNLKSLELAEVSACDQDKGRLEYMKGKYEIKAFENHNEAFSNETIDAVLVCTPTSEHVPLAIAAIEQGCHVFIEKPLSHNLEGVDDLIREAKRKGLVIMIGFNLRFHPNLQLIKELLDRGEIGKPISARAHFGSHFLYRLPFHSWKSYKEDYAAKEVGGGVILDAATHLIDYLSWLLGGVKEVFCYADRMSNLNLESEDIAEILLKLERGVIASLHVDFVQQPYQTKCEIIGEKGSIVWDSSNNKVNLFTETADRWQAFPETNFDYNETYVREIVHFIKCIYGQEHPLVDGIEGRRILKIALAAKESAKEGRAVFL